MSVTTDADRKRDEIRANVEYAIALMVEVFVVRKVWGADEYCDDYVKAQRASLVKLTEVLGDL